MKRKSGLIGLALMSTLIAGSAQASGYLDRYFGPNDKLQDGTIYINEDCRKYKPEGRIGYSSDQDAPCMRACQKRLKEVISALVQHGRDPMSVSECAEPESVKLGQSIDQEFWTYVSAGVIRF